MSKMLVSKTAAATLLSFACIALFSMPMSAQILPRGNVYAGLSYGQLEDVIPPTLSYKGWVASGEDLPFSRLSHLGIVLEANGYYRKGVDGGTISQYTALLGPRLSANFGKWRPFVDVMGGYQRVNSTGTLYNHIAIDIGGGADYKLPFRNFSWRFQGDYVRTHYASNDQNGYRASTGIVWRF